MHVLCIFSTNSTNNLHSIVRSRRPVVVPIEFPPTENRGPLPPPKLKVPEPLLVQWSLAVRARWHRYKSDVQTLSHSVFKRLHGLIWHRGTSQSPVVNIERRRQLHSGYYASIAMHLTSVTTDVRSLTPVRLSEIHFQIIHIHLAWLSTTSSARWTHFSLSEWHAQCIRDFCCSDNALYKFTLYLLTYCHI